MECPNCLLVFQKNARSYKRTKLKSLYTPHTRRTLFPALDEDNFVCYKCSDAQKSVTRNITGTRKRRLFSPRKDHLSPSSPLKTQLTSSPSVKSPLKKKALLTNISSVAVTKNVRKVVSDLVLRSRYRTAIRYLVQHSQAGKEAFIAVSNELLKSEISVLGAEDECIFKSPCTLESLDTFSWAKVVSQLKATAPVTSGVCRAIFPSNKTVRRTLNRGGRQSRPVSEDEAEDVINSRVGMVMAMAMYTSSPKKYKFVQSFIGIGLWRQGCSQKVFHSLNNLGISQGHSAAKANVDRIANHHADKILQLKSAIEDNEDSPGFSVGWDNVQIETEARHQGTGEGRENRMLLWAMCFAVENRFPTAHITDPNTIPARQISPWNILPKPTDFTDLQNRMVFVVKQILVDNIPFLKGVNVKRHLGHHQSLAMRSQSNVVNLGVIEANPTSTNGSTSIMRHLQQYCPVKEDCFIPLMCHGDNTSVERMRGSRHAAVNAITASGRLQGLVEGPQEFHKEALLLQDFMNTFFLGNSITSRGTVAQLKVDFRHRALKKKVMDNFKHSWDMMQFITEAYVVLLAMKLSGTNNCDDIPPSYPSEGPAREQQKWVQKLAMEIVDRCWLSPSTEDMRTVAESLEAARETGDLNEHQADKAAFPFCICRTDKDEPTILCCSEECQHEWFHLSCKGLREIPPEDEDWYCSEDCRNSSSYIYCICKKKMPWETMVQCHLGNLCHRREWYHLTCIGLKEPELPEVWYCSDECILGAEDDDCVLNHSKKVVWDGLNLLSRRDAVREGDGPAVISHWKIDMLQFWQRNHYKYFLSGCEMLTNVAGFLPLRLRQDIIWNRLVNVKGRIGGNIGMDLLNEFLNNDFKEMLKRSRGQYTDLQVRRVAQLSGAFGRQLDSMLTDSGLGILTVNKYHEKPKWLRDDIARFIREYEEDALFDYCPPRCHKAFEDFVNNRHITSPVKMGERMAEIMVAMDFWKDLRNPN